MKKIRFSMAALVLSMALAVSSCGGNTQTTTTEATVAAESTTTEATTTAEAAEKTTADTTTTEATTTEATTTTETAAADTSIAETTAATTAETTTAAKTTTTEATAATTTKTEATTTETTTTTAATTAAETQEKKYIALTFDDGPNTTTTMEVLDVLEKHGVVASFFLVGNNINDESAKSVKRAFDMGCEINNHSQSHSDMTAMTADEIKAEIKYTDDKIVEITGVAPKFFRPPYIAVNTDMFDAIDLPFIAGVGCNDWEAKVTAEMRYKRIIRQAKDGIIVLMHDAQGNSQTVEAIDMIIPELLSQGYEFVTMSQLFEIEGVEIPAASSIIYSSVYQTTMYY